MEEEKKRRRNKKRKEIVSPDQKSEDSVLNSTKKVKQSSLYDFMDSSEDEENRNRTPSGSVLEVDVKQLKNFFLRKSKRMSGKGANNQDNCDSQGVALNSEPNQVEPQNRPKENHSTVKEQQTPVNMIEVDPENSKMNVMNADLATMECEMTEESDDGNFDNSKDCDNQNSDELISPTKEQLFNLAKQLKTATEDDIKRQSDRVLQMRQQQKKQKGESRFQASTSRYTKQHCQNGGRNE